MMLLDTEGETLLEEYRLAVDRQAALLKRQQGTIDSLQDELVRQEEESVARNRQQQTKIESIVQQARAVAAEESAHELHLLKQEKEMALKEKELSQAEARRHAQEVQRLQTAAVTTPPVPTTHLDTMVEAEYHRVTQALEEEASRLRAEADRAEEEKVATLKLNIQLKQEVSSLKSQLEEARQEAEVLRQGVEENVKEVREAQATVASLTTKLTRQEEDMKILLAHVENLKRNKDQLVGVLSGVRSKLREGQARVAQSIRTAEDALREKDAALLREKHIREEVRRLEVTVGSVGDEAGKKVQEEVTRLKQHHTAAIRQLTQEVAQLQMDVNQKQLERERAMSSVRRAEIEVERLEGEAEKSNEERRKETATALHRTTTLEARIHHLEAQVERWRKEAQRSLEEREGERGEVDARVQELEARLSSTLEDCAIAKTEARQAKQTANDYAAKLVKAEQRAGSCEEYYQRQLRVKAEETDGCISSAKARLDAAEAVHKDTLKQVYQNMAALQDSHARMQDQLTEERQKWEKRVSELMRLVEVSRQEARQAVQRQRQAETKLLMAQEEVAQYTARTEEVEERLRAAERRFASAQFDVTVNRGIGRKNSTEER